LLLSQPDVSLGKSPVKQRQPAPRGKTKTSSKGPAAKARPSSSARATRSAKPAKPAKRAAKTAAKPVSKATAKPALKIQMKLFRNGQEIFTGKETPLDVSNQTDLKRLSAGGAMQLGSEMAPGEYILQVLVTDSLAKEKYRVASQWIDFTWQAVSILPGQAEAEPWTVLAQDEGRTTFYAGMTTIRFGASR